MTARQPSPELTRDVVALGRQLQAARKRAGLSFADAARALGQGHCDEDVAAIEVGRVLPSLQQLYTLAGLYGASVDVCVWAPAAARR